MNEPRACAVLDIDGVLADVRHRLHFVERRPKNWHGFFAAAPDDPPLADGLALATELDRDYDIVYVTGRPERCRRDTEAWLSAHGFPVGPLHMRRDDDRRPARMTKLQVLRQLSKRRPVFCMVDDDSEVVATLREAGFSVQQADWMHSANAQQTLLDIQETDGRT